MKDRIEAAAEYERRCAMDVVREVAAEILDACRPAEHVRPVNLDRMGQHLSKRWAA